MQQGHGQVEQLVKIGSGMFDIQLAKANEAEKFCKISQKKVGLDRNLHMKPIQGRRNTVKKLEEIGRQVYWIITKDIGVDDFHVMKAGKLSAAICTTALGCIEHNQVQPNVNAPECIDIGNRQDLARNPAAGVNAQIVMAREHNSIGKSRQRPSLRISFNVQPAQAWVRRQIAACIHNHPSQIKLIYQINRHVLQRQRLILHELKKTTPVRHPTLNRRMSDTRCYQKQGRSGYQCPYCGIPHPQFP
ncbi:hypothetical protein BX661DRAFT_18680 [Kickxella alabastrina]|uniref:uncharacterized protein n=1 Tax=Kickxella alabastrina TaxID=61397 RepID=UPI00221FA220|nr:uncharacterized protein BX661DRAFT_18680 [Kickxella alabastrina]KAI7827891.1 hypothetical protein BX661DRAFT_18680 [Kickxella alabastrina]